MLRALAFPGDGATPSWRKPPAEVVAAAQAWEITEPLRSLLRGRRPEARLRLDRLLLAYARGGFVPAAALREVHLDYQAMDDVPPLTEAEVATYAHVFWDFLSLDDPDAGLAYLAVSLPGS